MHKLNERSLRSSIVVRVSMRTLDRGVLFICRSLNTRQIGFLSVALCHCIRWHISILRGWKILRVFPVNETCQRKCHSRLVNPSSQRLAYSNIELSWLFLDLMNSFNQLADQSSTACLTDSSFDTCSFAVEQLNLFIDLLSSQHITDMSIQYEEIISIVSHSSNLVDCIDQHDYLLIEYAFDDYLYLDEHLSDLYDRVLLIIDHLCRLPFVNVDTYHLEKHLRRYLPHTYRPACSPSLPSRIGSTLIDRTSRLCAASFSVPSNDHDDGDHESIIPSSGLLSRTPVSISLNDEGTYASHNDHSRSLLQLDKINVHTSHGIRGQSEPSWNIDLRDLEQIEDDLSKNRIDEQTWESCSLLRYGQRLDEHRTRTARKSRFYLVS